MKKEPVLAVVGATGLVGREIVSIIKEKDLPYSEIKLLASASSSGEVLEFSGDEWIVEELNEESFSGVDIALFAAGSDVASRFIPIASEQGAICIDNSSFYRMNEQTPLVVPEVNASSLEQSENGNVKKQKGRVIANPNCTAIPLTMVLHALKDTSALKRVVVSTYQAVSGAGKTALDELWNQSLGIFNQQEVEPTAFPHQIAFNCIPQVNIFREDGYTLEEHKIIDETRKILELPELAVTCTAVRVPVFHSHSMSVNIEFESDVSAQQATDALEAALGIEVFAAMDTFPMPVKATGENEVLVGRIRKDSSTKHALDLWIVSDNLRKGAALNAVQIAELLIKQ